MENRVQNLIKFEQYGFKPSAVIKALNEWYERGGGIGTIFKIEVPDPKEGKRKHHAFYDHNKAIDDAIKYLRSMDIFYEPGMKWDDVKFNISTEACLREFGYPDIHSAWPKVNPVPLDYTDIYGFTEQKKKFDQWKTERDREARDQEIRDYILKRADMNGIKVPMTFRTGAVEDLMAYLFALLMQECKNKELAEEIRDRYRERIDRLRKELNDWDSWFNDIK